MKQHVYFKEDTQELKTLPINDDNCYYLGEFSEKEMKFISSYVSLANISFLELRGWVNYGAFNIENNKWAQQKK